MIMTIYVDECVSFKNVKKDVEEVIRNAIVSEFATNRLNIKKRNRNDEKYVIEVVVRKSQPNKLNNFTVEE